MCNWKRAAMIFGLLILALMMISCGPNTPPPIIPVDGTWTGTNDPVMITVSNGNITGVHWYASKMVYANSKYDFMQVSCGIDGNISIQADGSFTFNGNGVVGYGVFDSPMSGHVFATFTSCTARALNTTEMFPPKFDVEESITSDADIEPLK